MKRKFILAGVIASFLAFASALNGPANAQIGIGGRNALSNPVVSGVLSLADGTLALPSLTNTGDTDTGLFFPSADTVAFSVGGKDLGEWHVATGTLTATQVRKLNATPVSVIAAPGSGKALSLESVQLMLDWDSVAYDNVGAGEDLILEYGTGADILRCDESSCLNGDASADTHGLVFHSNQAFGQVIVNTNAQFTILNGEWANSDADSDGDSPIHYFIRYRVVIIDLS